MSVFQMRSSKFVCLFLLVITFALPSCVSSNIPAGRTLHVSVAEGSDGNPGTIERPFKSIPIALRAARAGDTINVAPGVYSAVGNGSHGFRLSSNGRPNAPITLQGTGPGVVLDCSGITAPRVVYCLQVESDWWQIQNISVTGGKQNSALAWVVGIHIVDASHNRLNNVQSFNHQGTGIMVTGNSAGNRIENCTSHSNYDPRTDIPGGNADGISVTRTPPSAVGNVINNCRAYENSDDGFDLWLAEAPVTISNSVARRNGFVPNTNRASGDGVGFKLGRNVTGPEHQIIGNRAINNRFNGFDRNGAVGVSRLVDNVATGNGNRNFVN